MVEGEELEDGFDVEELLNLVQVVGHEDDVEVGEGLEEGDVGDEDGGVFAAFFL